MSSQKNRRSASDARVQRQGEPRRRPHVADRLRAKGADRRRRGKDLRAREESGELRTESPLDAALCRIVGQRQKRSSKIAKSLAHFRGNTYESAAGIEIERSTGGSKC